MLANNIELDEIMAGVYNTLKADATLVAFLAESKPVNGDGPASKANSIIPMSKVNDEANTRATPLIGIRYGNMVRTGIATYDVFVFIRCYTSIDKSFVTTNKIMSQINKLLDRQFISFETAVTAQMSLEQLTGEEYDEGYKLNYREGQFRLTIT
jgi:hypothetical protein